MKLEKERFSGQDGFTPVFEMAMNIHEMRVLMGLVENALRHGPVGFEASIVRNRLRNMRKEFKKVNYNYEERVKKMGL